MTDWLLTYDDYDPDQEGHREALCTLGNGFFATRGAAPEAVADGVHYPGTYIAGVYNRLSSEIAGRVVENESLVNAPNWLPMRFRADGGAWFGDEGTEVLDHHLELDLRRAVLTRRSRLRDPEGRILQVTQRRFVNMRDPHLAALESTVVAENWSGRLEVCSAIDGTVRNDGVERYRDLPSQHLVPRRTHQENHEVVCLQTATSQSHIRIAMAARTRIFHEGERLGVEPETEHRDGYVALHFEVDVEEGDALTIEKVVSVFTSRDRGISEPGMEACDWVQHVAGGFDELLAGHVSRWSHLWDRLHIDLGTDSDLAMVLRLHLLHIIQTVSNHSVWLDVGVPARGLHGEAYRGHIFWDELFVIPFLSIRLPQLTRALLLYRYRRLDQARRAASDAGYAGAMFPWQSASNGREETQVMHLNPASGRWLPDASHLQRHVNAAIVFNVWQYYQATGDVEFLKFYGAEMILEIARFWASIATYDRTLDRYDINGVMGPDEYHERYPDRDEPGLDNNAYTNLMAVWCLCRAFDVLEALPSRTVDELKDMLVITQPELERWDDVSRKMRVCFHDGVISQFERYEELEELDWDAYRRKYGDIHRLDRILEAEGDTPNRYKLTKQADVMMLFYLLSAEEIRELFERLRLDWDDKLIPRTIEYYEPRTSHGSTLSRVVHSWIHARGERGRSWNLFVEALYSDVGDVQGGTTAEGIHLGAMAGTVDLLKRCYTGLEMRGDVLRFNPVIPEELGSLDFDLRYRGHLLNVHLTTDLAQIRVDPDEGAPIDVELGGDRRRIEPGDVMEVPLT
jgi:alpha,alpha-trehalase